MKFKLPDKIEMLNKRFGLLLVIAEIKEIGKPYYWKCICDCGKNTIVMGQKLRSGKTKSCGCLRFTATRTHGHGVNKRKTKEFSAWSAMIQRCCNPNNPNFKYYGAKGVNVCESWLSSFEIFFRDMGFAPTKNHSLDRIETYGNYEPGKCRWATRRVQDRNKRRNNYIEYNGRKLIITDWALEFGVKPPSIRYHLSNNKDFDWIYNHYKQKNKTLL